MISKEIFGLLSLVLSVVSYVPYVRSIFVANTKPHAFTWLVWETVMAIAFFAQLSDKAGAGSWATGLSAAFCLGIGVIALFRGEKHVTRGDWIAFIITFLAIPLWIVTSDPLWSVLLVTAIDAVAYYPTFRKSFAKPDEELAFKYVLTSSDICSACWRLSIIRSLRASTSSSAFSWSLASSSCCCGAVPS